MVIPSGLRGLIYYIPRDTSALPRFGELEPVGIIYTDTLNVPERAFTEGFPGVTDRVEWFAIDYTGRFWIAKPGDYRFALTSDDGTKLYIDGHLEIDNDGIHSPVRRDVSLRLEAGIHKVRVSYFQGPRVFLALVLEVAGPKQNWRAFSTDEFKPPPNPEDWNRGNARDLDVPTPPLPKTSSRAPRKARDAFVKGLSASSYRDWKTAEKSFHRAIELFPAYAQAWSSLGEVLEQESKPVQARKAYEKALATDAEYVKPYVHLANLNLSEGRDEDAVAATNSAMALRPVDAPLVYFYASVANAHLKRWDDAEKAARQAVEFDTAHEVPRAEYELGMILAAKGDIPGALDHMKKYLKISPQAQDAKEVLTNIAELERRNLQSRP